MNSPATADERAGMRPPTCPEGFGPPDLLRTIVTRPRATMRWILDHGDGGLWAPILTALLFALWTLGWFWLRATDAVGPRDFLDQVVHWYFAQLLILPVRLGLFLLATAIAARLVGGRGPGGVTPMAIAWGTVPMVAIFPPALLVASAADPASLLLPATLVMGGLTVLFSFWLCGFTVAEAHRIPSWRGHLAIALALGAYIGVENLAIHFLPTVVTWLHVG